MKARSFPRLGAESAATRVQGRQGAVLGLVLIVMLVLSLLGVGMLHLATMSGLEAGRSVSSAQAFWAAEAGAEHAKALAQRYRRPMNTIPCAGSPTGFLWGSNVLTGATGQGTYSVDVLDDPAWTNAVQALRRYLIRSRGTSAGGRTQTVTVRAMVQSFASYMHASNWERQPDGDPIYFGDDDVLDGPVYVNDTLNIFKTPRFLQRVQSAASTVNYSAGGSAAVFEGGLTLGAPVLDISGQFTSGHIQTIRSQALSGGLALNGNYDFTFNASGSFTYRPSAGGATVTNYLAALNGAIYVNGSASVKGAVNGNVTLAAQDTIYIPTNIAYASALSPDPWDAGFNPSAVDDSLGLIASNRVVVQGSSPIDIHASIMVTGGDDGFGAAQWNSSIGKPAINLYGGVSQFRRGLVGRVSGQGFRKNYRFDPRFLTQAPPNFPYSLYLFDSWRQSTGGG